MTQPDVADATLTVQRTIPRSLLIDIVVTAIEGGIDYWINVSTYDPAKGTATIYFDPFSTEQGEKEQKREITPETVLAGLQLLASEKEIKWLWAETRTRIVGAALGDPEDFFVREDAGTADVIVQLGLFGEVVFG